MAQIKLRDEVGGSEVELDLDDQLTVGAAIEHLIALLGLPQRSTNGIPLIYTLAVDGQLQPDPARSLHEAGVGDGTALTLVSPEARDVWTRVGTLVDGLRAEVAAGIRGEIQGAGERIRQSAVDELRGAVSAVTGEIESEVTRRIRGTGKQISAWARFRIRRMAKQLARTGAIPDELRALSFATGQLSRAAQAALVAPVAALALAATGAAAAAALEAQNAGDKATAAQVEATRALELAEDAGRRAEAAEVRADAAETRAAEAQNAADTAQATADTHQADRNDPHGIDVVATVGDHVVDRLGLDPGLTALWLSEVLGAAERQIDEHLSTAYTASDAAVTPARGDSLWQIAERVLSGEIPTSCDLPGTPNSTRTVAAYVADLWVANVGVIGSDANLIEADQPIQIVCPRG